MEIAKNLENHDGDRDGFVAVGGYNMDMPPQDDVCPICFGDFEIPCKTNCGHWFCAVCILRYWKFSGELSRCKCPMCVCLISKLIPDETSIPTRPKEEICKIHEKIQRYNQLNAGGCRSLLKEASMLLPSIIRRGFRENLNPIRLRNVFLTVCLIGKLLGKWYARLGLNFFPNGARGIEQLFEIFAWILAIYLTVEHVRFYWRHLRERRFAQLEDSQHMV